MYLKSQSSSQHFMLFTNGTVMPLVLHPQGIVLEDHSLPDLQPAQRRTVYFSVMETIARLHRLPLGELELLLDPEKAHSDMRTFWNWQVNMAHVCMCVVCGVKMCLHTCIDCLCVYIDTDLGEQLHQSLSFWQL